MNTQNAKKKYATVLSIAGSDSIGGAGIQADIKTCTAMGAYAMTAITAITAQNTMGVRSYEAVSNDMLQGQLNAVIEDIRPDAVKIGMLPTIDAVKIVAKFLEANKIENVVLDPVCVATSGDALTAESVPASMIKYLFSLATVVTPNLCEAQLLSGVQITDRLSFEEAANRIINEHGAGAVLMKGGHSLSSAPNKAEDILFIRKSKAHHMYASQYFSTENTHGTGCTLSSAIAVGLAKGKSLVDAVADAKEYISQAIQVGAEYWCGHGHGALCHNFTMLK